MRETSATRRRWGATAALAATAVVVVLAGACANDKPKVQNASGTSSNGTNMNAGRSPQGSGAPPAGTTAGGATGQFTAEFAACMREHGVPNFPDPNGTAGQLGPNSGIDPASPQFQSALNGPCKSLAPTAWLSSDSGPDTVAGSGG
jgi:hypothetical protein